MLGSTRMAKATSEIQTANCISFCYFLARLYSAANGSPPPAADSCSVLVSAAWNAHPALAFNVHRHWIHIETPTKSHYIPISSAATLLHQNVVSLSSRQRGVLIQAPSLAFNHQKRPCIGNDAFSGLNCSLPVEWAKRAIAISYVRDPWRDSSAEQGFEKHGLAPPKLHFCPQNRVFLNLAKS